MCLSLSSKLHACSLIPNNFSIENLMELYMKVLLNCIRSLLFASLHIDKWTVLRYGNIRETFMHFSTTNFEVSRTLLHIRKIVGIY